MPNKEVKKEILYTYLPPGVLKFLKQDAVEKEVTLSTLITNILKKHYASTPKKFPSDT